MTRMMVGLVKHPLTALNAEKELALAA